MLKVVYVKDSNKVKDPIRTELKMKATKRMGTHVSDDGLFRDINRRA
jgi:hypothetical protein